MTDLRPLRCLLAAALLLACSEPDLPPAVLYAPQAPGPQNLLLISIDTLRADHVGSYGYARPTTPNLDRIAAEGVLFEQAWAQSPWTLPSHASLLTGLYTRGHGLRDDHHQLSRSVPVLSEMLGKAGYRAGAIVNTHYLLGRTNLVRGVELFEYLRTQDDQGARVLSLPRGVDEALEFLRSEDPRPFFLLLHTYDVHSDYLPEEAYRQTLVRPYDGELDGSAQTLLSIRRGDLTPDEDDLRHLVDLYDAAIRQMDDRLGRLFDFLDQSGQSATTLLVITSDHGEEFYEHGDVLHGRSVYEEMLRVPLLVRGPGVPRSVRVSTPVALVDVLPTMLRAAGLPPPPGIDGRDLAAAWQEPADSDAPPVFAEVDARKLARKPAGNLTATRQGHLKLIHDREHNSSKLFDLSSDPRERADLASVRPRQMRRLLEVALEHIESRDVEAEATGLSAEERTLLERLGYAE